MSLTRVSRFGFVNAYLVEEEDGLTLVDTTIPGSAKAILAAAEELGRPIVRIALTHAHGDHIGSLDALAKTLPDIEIAISERDARLLAKNTTTDPGEPPEAKMRGSYPGAKTRPTRTLTAGDRVGSLEVVAAPGHTPGHVAFLDTRDRTLIAGDAYSTIGGVATTREGQPALPAARAGDLAQADRARERPRPARPRPVPPRGRPRPHRRRPRRRDGQGDREAPPAPSCCRASVVCDWVRSACEVAFVGLAAARSRLLSSRSSTFDSAGGACELGRFGDVRREQRVGVALEARRSRSRRRGRPGR